MTWAAAFRGRYFHVVHVKGGFHMNHANRDFADTPRNVLEIAVDGGPTDSPLPSLDSVAANVPPPPSDPPPQGSFEELAETARVVGCPAAHLTCKQVEHLIRTRLLLES